VRRFPLLLTLAVLAVGLAGCTVDVSSSGASRAVLEGPDFIASGVAETTEDPQARWLLRQPGGVRSSYVDEVLDGDGDAELLAEAWLLRQSDEVRESYVREVVEPELP
jgi:hypothetical protein